VCWWPARVRARAGSEVPVDVDEHTYLGGADDFTTVRHLTIRGTNREIGQTLAEIARAQSLRAAGQRSRRIT
jgi:hypothetical protein